jgi:hypothetical protein
MKICILQPLFTAFRGVLLHLYACYSTPVLFQHRLSLFVPLQLFVFIPPSYCFNAMSLVRALLSVRISLFPTQSPLFPIEKPSYEQ